jgi:hypothetical protein
MGRVRFTGSALLANRLKAQAKNPDGLPIAVAIHKHKTSNGSVNLHGCLQHELNNGRLLHRPHPHKADARMAWFVTAIHICRCQKPDRACH